VVLAMVALMWVREIVDTVPGGRLDPLGIEPRHVASLSGIALAPFLHAGFRAPGQQHGSVPAARRTGGAERTGPAAEGGLCDRQFEVLPSGFHEGHTCLRIAVEHLRIEHHSEDGPLLLREGQALDLCTGIPGTRRPGPCKRGDTTGPLTRPLPRTSSSAARGAHTLLARRHGGGARHYHLPAGSPADLPSDGTLRSVRCVHPGGCDHLAGDHEERHLPFQGAAGRHIYT